MHLAQGPERSAGEVELRCRPLQPIGHRFYQRSPVGSPRHQHPLPATSPGAGELWVALENLVAGGSDFRLDHIDTYPVSIGLPIARRGTVLWYEIQY